MKKIVSNLHVILRNIELLLIKIYGLILTQIAKKHVRFGVKRPIHAEDGDEDDEGLVL